MKTIFRYSAVISSISNGSVFVRVSINGHDVVIKCSKDKFPFKISEDMLIIAEGVLDGKKKKLIFKKSVPLKLTKKQEQMIEKIVDGFKNS